MPIRIVNRNKLDDFQGAEVLCCYVREVAEEWPDSRMSTREGRAFHFVEDGIGSIARRIQARGFGLSARDIDWLERNVSAAFVELGSRDAPLIFANSDEGIEAWIELHRLSGIKMSAEECERLGIEADCSD